MVASGSWAPTSGCDNQVEGIGGKEGESNREYSSKVLASIRSILCMNWYQMEGLYLWTELQNARIEGKA